MPWGYITSSPRAEASANLARFDGVRYGHRTENPSTLQVQDLQTRAEGFGEEVKRRIILGTYVLSSGYYDAYYLRAQKVRTLIRRDFTDAFARVDAIIAPTSPEPAFRIGDRSGDPLRMYLADIFTIAANLAGICGISLPCGFASVERRQPAHRPAKPRQTLRRAAASANRRRVRAIDGVAQSPSATLADASPAEAQRFILCVSWRQPYAALATPLCPSIFSACWSWSASNGFFRTVTGPCLRMLSSIWLSG